MAAEQDHYLILGIDERASQADIRSAYRRAARSSHPDLHPGQPDAAARFKRIQEAYVVLSDPARRAAYRRPRLRPSPPAANGVRTSVTLNTYHPGTRTEPSTISPELIEAIQALRALARQVRLQQRIRRLVRLLNDL